jgi:hypothetical protein
MSNNNYTPNKVISKPADRKIVNTVLAIAGAITAAAIAADAAAPLWDISFITLPVAAAVGSLTAAYQIFVTNANIPK